MMMSRAVTSPPTSTRPGRPYLTRWGPASLALPIRMSCQCVVEKQRHSCVTQQSSTWAACSDLPIRLYDGLLGHADSHAVTWRNRTKSLHLCWAAWNGTRIPCKHAARRRHIQGHNHVPDV